ncbi:hypothetical protein FEM03_16470 [Phragmitibacter flavus]|uniref:Uncharacterized protein n=1 Tax=Phragmitibacter flavus TaxID=2576071 RepID=A0A5R8KB61_9BACT|nr:hypothetical protein [Phragmitibacter flavus]TLD69552.1 hypothetical protein FEM03_16470 [Phragmitibacter flavus]
MKLAIFILTLILTVPSVFANVPDTEVTSQGEFVRFYTETNPEVSSHGVFSVRKSQIACVMCEKAQSSDGYYQVWITSIREAGNGGISIKYKFARYDDALKFVDRVSSVIGQAK